MINQLLKLPIDFVSIGLKLMKRGYCDTGVFLWTKVLFLKGNSC